MVSEDDGPVKESVDQNPLEDEPDIDAREAFSLLGHEIRLEILLALLEDWVAIYTEPKSYAELMEAVGIRDSGKFNYHLEQLRGIYVRKVDDGYVPTASATALYRAVLAHRPTETFALEPTPIDADCPVCGSGAVLRYERGFVSIDCDDCEEWVGFTYSLPQRAFDRQDVDAVLEVLDARVRHDLAIARRGQCPDCAGEIAVDPRIEAVDDDAHWMAFECSTCSFVLGIDLLSATVTDDRVAMALRELGIDPHQYLWELPAGTVRLESRDPTRLTVDLDGETGTVTVVVDEEVAIATVTVRSSSVR
ncbi:winged helix-turn-helix domain-containing protein [Natronolimnohabitans sp. A-GB9]|uniref:winged helix-turn-helix domain-containing protein n=1 Tax=Natronolimnohabitans sp. A-GB9 TaxID=3069757 RepID=UPI0027B36BD6|nr:winged helix-turn-helix domain-containing protein [Natronolimnohabitans sp. A-GB9]MDQ2050088.1 winged helix-turn-helix domain-containing protein [Natronolimnohabitans sp. A-GB9]